MCAGRAELSRAEVAATARWANNSCSSRSCRTKKGKGTVLLYVGLGGRVNEEKGGWLVVLTLPALIVSNRKFGLPFWELIWQINADKMQATGQGQSSKLEAESRKLDSGLGRGIAWAN